jgi:integrase
MGVVCLKSLTLIQTLIHKELESVWDTFAKCSKQQKAKVLRAWKDFIKITKITDIDDITAQVAIAFQDNVHTRKVKMKGGVGLHKLAGKQQQHIFSGVKTFLGFAKKRGMAVEEMAKALEFLKLMQPNESTKNIDPKPISVEDWHLMLANASGDDKAMILLMLNAAMYAGEVIRVQWSDIKSDGTTLVTRRKKKGEMIRCATLWPETIEALKTVEKKSDHIFLATGGRSKGNPLKKDGAFNRLRDLSVDAKCPDVTPSHLRDGAFTAATAGNVSDIIVNILVGHSNGQGDNYILANPSIVKPACDAVHKHYFETEKAIKAMKDAKAAMA